MNDVTKQVVAGMSYTILGIFEDENGERFDCQINIWERVWLKGPEGLIITVKSKQKYVADPSGAQGSSFHEMKIEF